jgi:hypothetical protein
MIRSGTRQSVAMSISGHRTASMFARYNVTDDSDQRQGSAEWSELQRCSSQPGFDKTGEAARTTTETVQENPHREPEVGSLFCLTL